VSWPGQLIKPQTRRTHAHHQLENVLKKWKATRCSQLISQRISASLSFSLLGSVAGQGFPFDYDCLVGSLQWNSLLAGISWRHPFWPTTRVVITLVSRQNGWPKYWFSDQGRRPEIKPNKLASINKHSRQTGWNFDLEPLGCQVQTKVSFWSLKPPEIPNSPPPMGTTYPY